MLVLEMSAETVMSYLVFRYINPYVFGVCVCACVFSCIWCVCIECMLCICVLCGVYDICIVCMEYMIIFMYVCGVCLCGVYGAYLCL